MSDSQDPKDSKENSISITESTGNSEETRSSEIKLEETTKDLDEGTRIHSAKSETSPFDSATVIRPSLSKPVEEATIFRSLDASKLRLAEEPSKISSTKVSSAPAESTTFKERPVLKKRKQLLRINFRRLNLPAIAAGFVFFFALLYYVFQTSSPSSPEPAQPKPLRAAVEDHGSYSNRLKIEFMADVHNAMEKTKAHAPVF